MSDLTSKIKLLVESQDGADQLAKLFPIIPIPAAVGDALTCARALDTATRVNSAGAIETVVATKPRITWELGVDQCPNLLVERSRTNLFATPLVPATQNVTVVNATVYTVSVVGSGSITLSGAGSGVVTEANPITFTSAGTTLTCTVAGSLGGASVTAGAVAMSVANGTANADVISKTGIGTLLDGAKGLFVDCYLQAGSLSDSVARVTSCINDGSSANRILIYRNNDTLFFECVSGGVAQTSMNVNILAPFKNKRIKIFFSFEENSLNVYVNGALVATDLLALMPVNLSAVDMCYPGGILQWNGLIKAVAVTDELTTTEIDQLFQYASYSEMSSEMLYETV